MEMTLIHQKINSFEDSIFINCPFDEFYINDLLKPILYMVVKNGLNPRLSLEVSDSGYIRFSETLKINKQSPPLKSFYDFVDFNTNLFEEKLKEFGSDKLAKNYIEKISIPEYIQEISERL